MTHGTRRATLLITALLMSNASVAQERLTLEEAIARGLQQSARLAELQAREAAAGAAEQSRGAARLPPTFATSESDPVLKAKMQEIGESDRMTLKFRKPG